MKKKVDPYERQKKYHERIKNIRYDFDGTLHEVINCLIQHNEALKKDGFEDLSLSINTYTGYYDSSEVDIYIIGSRLETDAEYNSRIKIHERFLASEKERKSKQAKNRRDPEWEQYQALKKKFETNN